ncbi:hypothetical protein ES703_11085 [subsurface metagenome]
MIDKIVQAFMEEARTRPGKDLTRKMFSVLTELDAKLMEIFEDLNPDFMVWLPDDPEELAWNSQKAYQEEVKRRHDRANL